MLTLVEVRTGVGSLLQLPLEDISDGLLIEEIDGLDPVKATLVSSSFAQMDGAQYQSARREARNIKFKIGLEPDYATVTVRDLRKRVYAYFMPKSQVSLKFYDSDGLIVDIPGTVESCESSLFSAEPAMDISLMCFDPDFIDPEPVALAGNTVATSSMSTIEYDGSVETGMLFKLNVNRTLAAFSIYHQPPDGSLRTLDFAGSLVSGDVVTISTVPGEKFVTLTRGGVDSSLLYAISPQSAWTEFQPGDNLFRVYATGAAIPYTIEYTNKYGGL